MAIRWTAALVALMAFWLAAGPAAAATRGRRTVDVRLLAFNDFHGNLEPPRRLERPDHDAGRPGRRGRRRVPRHRTSSGSAGRTAPDPRGRGGRPRRRDPAVSALFHDEPTIEALNRIGLDYSAVGNHEFDEGAAELLRLQSGGCHPRTAARTATPFRGARFRYLGANVVRERSGRTLLAPYAIRQRRRGADRLHRADARGHAADRQRRRASAACSSATRRRRSTRTCAACAATASATIVVLLHEGGAQTGRLSTTATESPARSSTSSSGRQAIDVVRQRPHAPGLQLRDRRPARDQRRARSAAWSPTSTCASTGGRRASCRERRGNDDRHPRRAQGPGADALIARYARARRADRRRRIGEHVAPTIDRTPSAPGESRARRRHRRRAARRHADAGRAARSSPS